MIQVRKNIFETNSSSTHCLVIASKSDWDKFKRGEMVLNMYSGELKPVPENFPKQNAEGKWEYKGEIYELLEDINDRDFQIWDRSQMTYDGYMDYDSHEEIEKTIGDNVIVSIYGYDE